MKCSLADLGAKLGSLLCDLTCTEDQKRHLENQAAILSGMAKRACVLFYEINKILRAL